MFFLPKLLVTAATCIASICISLVMVLSGYSLAIKGMLLFSLFIGICSLLINISNWECKKSILPWLIAGLGCFSLVIGYKVLKTPSLHFFVSAPGSLVRLQCISSHAADYPTLPSHAKMLQAYATLFGKEFWEPYGTNANSTHLKHTHLLSHDFYYYHNGVLAFLLHEIFAAKNYAFKTTNPTPFIIDCGSNIGVSIVFFKYLYPQAHILSFEAAPDAFAALKKTIETNQFKNVTIHNKAVFNNNGTLNIPVRDVSAGCPGGSVLGATTASKETIAIPCVKLSDYIDRDVDMLKMDVEGAESEVFEDLAKHNKLQHIQQMIVEFHNMAKQETRPSLASFLQLLDQNGFVYIIDSNARTPFSIKDNHPILVYATRK